MIKTMAMVALLLMILVECPKEKPKYISIDEMESAIRCSPSDTIPLYVHYVTVTGYNATSSQCDSTPNILADNTRINIYRAGSYRFCALSRDLLKRWGGKYSFGDTICLNGNGRYAGKWVVRDVMNSRHRNSIDLLVSVGNIPKKHSTQAVRIARN